MASLFNTFPISCTTYLQELDLSYIVFNDRHVNLIELFGAVKSNGSLHAIRPHDLGRSLWSPNQARLVEAYSQRNRLLPALIKSAAGDVAKDDEMNSTDSCSKENSTAIPPAATSEPSPVIAKHSMLPVLCLAALGTPRMTAQHFFTGTVALDDSIRPVPRSVPRKASPR
jgi:hypothetical protein